MRATRQLAAALLSMLTMAPATAAILPPAPDPVESASAAPSPAIADRQEAGSDRRIAERLSGIFRELPAFRQVRVAVSEGVVTLGGTVPGADDGARAEAIAGRVAGVVTVENGIARDVSLDTNIAALGGLRARIGGFVAMLPLIGLALGVGIAIAAFGYLLGGLGAVWHRLAPNSFFAELIAAAIRFVFTVLGIIAALDMLGASALLGAVLGGAGVIGIALGFAMRDTIENFVASLMLSLRQPFRANDWVLIDDMEGRVVRLTSRATILMTLDGNHLRIPNSTVFKAVILNYTTNPQRRFDFQLGIDADDDPTAARHLGIDVLRSLPFVLADPPPTARLVEVGDSNIVISFLGWIDQADTDWFKAKSWAIPAVKVALEEAGFALPEPIYRLRFDSAAPLPIERSRTGAGGDTRKRAAPPPAVHDVAPENEVAAMVEEERRGSRTAEADLLDAGRPVE